MIATTSFKYANCFTEVSFVVETSAIESITVHFKNKGYIQYGDKYKMVCISTIGPTFWSQDDLAIMLEAAINADQEFNKAIDAC